MTTINLAIDLASEAAISLEFITEIIETELARLHRLGDAAGPSSDRDADFQRHLRPIYVALHALRGQGLTLTDTEAHQARLLWKVADAVMVPRQDLFSHEQLHALMALSDVLFTGEATTNG